MKPKKSKTLPRRTPPGSAFFVFVFFVFVFFVSAISIGAVPLAEYRRSVSRVKSLLGSLRSLQQHSSGAALTQAERLTIADVRRALPARQTVEFGNLSVEADNAWLEKDLQNYEKLQPAASEREILLEQMLGRLSALDARLAEVETANQAARGKNEDKQKLDEILRRPEFQKPDEREKSVLERWWESFRQWWRNLFNRGDDRKEPIAPATDYSALAGVLRYAVIILALAVVVFVIWRFALPLFSRNRKIRERRKKEPRVILGETLAPEETATTLFGQAERLAAEGDVRAAIRKGYIALLCELSDRKIIGLARYKTNRDYLRDLHKRDEIFQPTHAMTNSFEQHWYGARPANDEDWTSFRGNYEKAVQSSKLKTQSSV